MAAGALHGETFYVTVAGLGGEPEYEQRFTGWASDLTKLLQNEPNAKVDSLIGSAATKANIEAKLKTLAGQIIADVFGADIEITVFDVLRDFADNDQAFQNRFRCCFEDIP